ncbi:hypothetical protein AAIB33_19045 [Microbacterium sp. AZCO]|uniref:hypothetical protein n=1 Tax=Microbacterium sp. AZCO TaxID=3142976 RepID=UPI0031F35E3E
MPEVRIKKRFSALAGAVLAAALVIAPLTAAGASAAAPVLGTVGTIEAATSDGNHESYWQARYASYNATCYKHSLTESTVHGAVTDGGKTVTLAPFQSSWPGNGWAALIVNSGTSNNVIVKPVAGIAYASPVNNGGQQATVSHWIVCKGTLPTPPSVVTPSLTFTPASCLAAGAIVFGQNVVWSSVKNADGTTTWTASPKAGTVFPANVTTSWTVPDLTKLSIDLEGCRPTQPSADESETVKTTFVCAPPLATITTTTTKTPYDVWDTTLHKWVAGTATSSDVVTTRPLTADEQATCEPEEPELPTTTVDTKPWVDGSWKCGDTTVLQTREVITTVTPTEGEPTVTKTSEQQTRKLTQSEIGTCPLVPGKILSACVGDVPYLSYSVDLPEGFVASSEKPVTITFVNGHGGEDYVVTGQPLSGKLLWPGASDAEPKMWPGWDLVDGQYVETSGNYAWTRLKDVVVKFRVNPEYETTVTYPEATAECANPALTSVTPDDPTDPTDPTGDPTDPSDPAPAPSVTPTPASASTDNTLAITGGTIQLGALGLGALAVLAGVGMTIVSVRRSRKA